MEYDPRKYYDTTDNYRATYRPAPLLQRRHYEVIADAIGRATANVSASDRVRIVRAVARDLSAYNDLFDHDLFVGRAVVGVERYAVVQYQPGYLADDVDTFETEHEARDYAVSIANEVRDEYGRGAVSGNRSRGYVFTYPGRGEWVVDIVDRYDDVY